MSKMADLAQTIEDLETLIAAAESVCEIAFSNGEVGTAEDAYEELCRLKRDRAVLRDTTGF